MEEGRDKIIVLKKYDSSIDANLAKTKLDAYGIPCFLTEENLTNLYPLQNLLLFGVRLHIFDNDKLRAQEILEQIVAITDDEPNTCPTCRSKNVTLDYSRKFDARLTRIIMGFLMGLFMPLKKAYRCQDCQREF